MFNLYDLVKSGATIEEITNSMVLLKLVVVELNELLCGYDIKNVFNAITKAISKDTDGDFEESYFLTTCEELDQYFRNKISDAKKYLTELDEAKYDIVNSARSEIKHRVQ